MAKVLLFVIIRRLEQAINNKSFIISMKISVFLKLLTIVDSKSYLKINTKIDLEKCS
jgi:hypothetical protein